MGPSAGGRRAGPEHSARWPKDSRSASLSRSVWITSGGSSAGPPVRAGGQVMPQITVNQQPQTLPEPATVADLLRHLNLDARRVAVEVNRDVVPRARYAEH